MNNQPELYIGLISGTSADGIDAVLVDFSQKHPKLVATHYAPYTTTMREKVLGLCQPGENEIQRMGELDILLGETFAQTAQTLLKQENITAAMVKAIGSHGQTIRHIPQQPRFTLQIGDPNIIAVQTGITTVADFRRKDIAFGGQGAPLVPAFHQHMFSAENTNRIIVNIGGISNITVLNPAKPDQVIGFDTGPGNVLMDAWIHLHKGQHYDKDGAWCQTGKVNQPLLQQLLTDPYFKLPAPKSTGREYFNLEWLLQQMENKQMTLSSGLDVADVQTTLAELTAETIIEAIKQQVSSGEILVCGGGAHNKHLMQRLSGLAGSAFHVESTSRYGIDPDWVEAFAFAWLAKQTLNQQPGNLPSVTGAKQATILGGVYYA